MFTEYNELLLKLLFKLVGPTKQLERFLCIRQRDLSFASLVVDKIRTSQFPLEDYDSLFQSGNVLTQSLLHSAENYMLGVCLHPKMVS
jgi:hypothetical protein